MDKFGRNYELTVNTSDGVGTISVAPPFTIEFDVTRNTLTSANVCQIRIYNLNQLHRNQIRRNITSYGPPFQGVTLRAGYGKDLALIFSGNVSQCWSVREGNNFISQIECFDGGFAFSNGKTDLQFPAGVLNDTVIHTTMNDLPHVTQGAIGSYPGSLSRGNSYSGPTTQILSQLTGGGFFIDNGKANALGTNEHIAGPGGIVRVDARSGLLGTPVLERSILHFDMLFEPQLNVGYLVLLDSLTESSFNGQYKITAVKHRGMISDAVCGSVITTGEFYYDKLLTGVASTT